MHDGSIDQLTEHVIGCAIAVHRELGPGLLESIYRDSLVLELRANDLEVAVESECPCSTEACNFGTILKSTLRWPDAS